MTKTLSFCATAALAALGLNAEAQEIAARVISATPVVQQVQVPRTICSEQPTAVQQQHSGAGAVIGAIAGAAFGNAIGAGSGRAAATALGAVGGAAFGDRVEGNGAVLQNRQSCGTQMFLENRTVAYNVTYEYEGRQATVQMANDPGPTVRLQLTPIVGSGRVGPDLAVGQAISAPPGTPVERAVVASASPVYPAYSAYSAYPAYESYPAYAPAYPAYYPGYSAYPSYYAPIGLSLGFGFGFGGGWGGGHHHHGGHRGGGHRGHGR